MSQKQTKSCLVISYGPVPTPQYQTVEGGGMRAWGLAKGLAENGVAVTVAINDSFPQSASQHEGIALINWSLNDAFADLINKFDTVIMSYCMGDPSVFVVDNLLPNVQLILDVYVPIYVEVSARDTDDMPAEYSAYQQDIARHNKVLKRGDYFICANNVQKIFYTGVLGSLGVVNPLSYRQDRIKVVPFGIHDTPAKAQKNPYQDLGITKDNKTILWFGGLYPWFRIEDLLDAIKTLYEKDSSYRFVIVGGKNPFNNNPDLLRQYEAAQAFASKHKLLNKCIFFVDWVDYETRMDWYEHADFAISINQPGDENAFAWRTRVMDYIWGELVSLTNGSDPLGDELLENNAAIQLKDLKEATIVETIQDVYQNPDKLKQAKQNLLKLKPKYFWTAITHNLSNIVSEHTTPYSNEATFVIDNGLAQETTAAESIAKRDQNKLVKAIKNPRKVLAYARKKGIRKSLVLGKDIVTSQLKKRTGSAGRFILIGHPIDHSGAPVVLLQIIDELVEKYGARRIRLITPSIEPKIAKRLRAKGVRIEKAAHMSYGLTAAQLGLRKNDFVLMNTIAVYDNYRDVCLNMLAHDRIHKLHWFIHEDEDQLKTIKPDLLTKSILKKISKLADNGRLKIYVPSLRVKQYYDKLLKVNTVQNISLRIDVPKEYLGSRPAADFNKLSFYLTGSPADGRKGQLIALSAFQHYLLKYHVNNPKQYRDFDLKLIAIRDDYISTQIKAIGKSTLGDRLHIYPPIPLEEALKLTHESNVVICCSLNETFGIYIAEGMLMGHIVLRNDSAGVDEQLVDGKNGFAITDDIEQFAAQIEKLLNKNTSNVTLQKMGAYSQKMMLNYANNRYLNNLDS